MAVFQHINLKYSHHSYLEFQVDADSAIKFAGKNRTVLMQVYYSCKDNYLHEGHV